MVTRHPQRRRSPLRPGFTLTELLVTIGVIAVLLGLLLPALSGVWSTGAMTESMSNMRQISTWMQQYSGDNNDAIVPSRFNYAGLPGFKGKVRSSPNPAQGEQHSGTWADILAAEYLQTIFLDAAGDPGLGGRVNDYRYDAPDRNLYEKLPVSSVNNPFRSAATNTRIPRDCSAGGAQPDDDPTPYGKGAVGPERNELGLPGFFAANDFFWHSWTTDPAQDVRGYRTNGQIRYPSRSMYLVDSYFGETIADQPEPFDNSADANGCRENIEVDFRYGAGDVCLMLFLDGHVDPVNAWEDIIELEGDPEDPEDNGRGIRIRDLTSRNVQPAPAGP